MPYTILVVEDNQGLRESMALYLRKLNHNVYEAQTVEKGMEQARQIEFDVAIADYRLADGLGVGPFDQHTLGIPQNQEDSRNRRLVERAFDEKRGGRNHLPFQAVFVGLFDFGVE